MFNFCQRLTHMYVSSSLFQGPPTKLSITFEPLKAHLWWKLGNEAMPMHVVTLLMFLQEKKRLVKVSKKENSKTGVDPSPTATMKVDVWF